MLPLNRFLSFIEQNELCKPGDKILLALSGGKDSVLMAHLFNEAGFTFGIAHCNFGLRGAESDEDEALAENLAIKFGVPFYHKTFNTVAFAEEEGVSIQMAARELRYTWFEEIRKTKGFNHIALAHHQNDEVETVLLNLVRGTGIAGLHGILAKREKLIRPLLFLKREEIDQIVLENKLPYREDSSNSSVKYARNKLRLEVIPRLKDLNPLLENTFKSNSQRFKELEDFLDQQVNSIKAELFQMQTSGDVLIDLKKLQALSPRKLLLFELFKSFNFRESVLNDLINSWDGHPGKVFESSSHRIILDRNTLIVTSKGLKKVIEIKVNQNDKNIRWDSFSSSIKRTDADGFVLNTSKNMAFFDEGLLHFPLTLRQWIKGDYFFPFGMNGRKKLSDFFTELKLPLTAKEKVPVLVNGNGDILWIVGYRTDDRYKITPRTKKVIIFETQNTP